MCFRSYGGLVLKPSSQDQEDEVAREEGEHHTYEMCTKLSFESPVVPVNFCTQEALKFAKKADLYTFHDINFNKRL